MTIAGTLPLRLSAAGCKTAGTQLEAELADLKKNKVKLLPDVLTAAAQIAGVTDALRQSAGQDVRAVDTPTDTAVASLDDALEARIKSLGGEEVLPLTDAQRAERELAVRVRRELLADGTGFVNAPYRQQWARLEQLDRDLTAHAKDLATLGLATQASRLQAWIGLYGQRLGITRAGSPGDEVAQQVEAWHEAWQELVDVVRGQLLRSDRATAERLLGPYEQQAAAERQARRGKRKPAQD